MILLGAKCGTPGGHMAQARESKLLVSALKRCLKMKGVTYKSLALSMNLSESSVKRLFASNNLSIQRFEQVCEILGMSIFDIGKLAREEPGNEDPHSLSREQEWALAENVNLLIGFHLILNGWSFDQINSAFNWSEPELIKIFTTLDKLKLVALQPENKVKILTANNIRWRKDGAVRKRHEKLAFKEFLNDNFNNKDQLLDFEILELSPASSNILKRKLQLVLKEINDLAAMDYMLKPSEKSEKKSTGIMLAMRPWVFSLAIESMTENYKRGKSY
jgi:transcriptional regulator with XRE-family HTH domain